MAPGLQRWTGLPCPHRLTPVHTSYHLRALIQENYLHSAFLHLPFSDFFLASSGMFSYLVQFTLASHSTPFRSLHRNTHGSQTLSAP